MSLRPEMIGFNLEKLRKTFGSNDAVLLDALNNKPHEYDMTPDAATAYRDMAEQLIKTGQLGDLLEDSVRAILVSDVVMMQQDILVTEMNFWEYDEDYFYKVEQLLKDRDKHKLGLVFTLGRPFWGYEFESELRYGYLANEELSQILEIIHQNPQAFYDDEGLGEDFVRWLNIIGESKKDLFFFTA